MFNIKAIVLSPKPLVMCTYTCTNWSPQSNTSHIYMATFEEIFTVDSVMAKASYVAICIY